MVDILPEFFQNVREVTALLVILMGILLVLKTWYSTKSFVPTLGMIIVSAVAIFMVTNYAFFRSAAEDDMDIYQDGRRVLDDSGRVPDPPDCQPQVPC